MIGRHPAENIPDAVKTEASMWHRRRNMQRGIGDAPYVSLNRSLNGAASICKAGHIVNRLDALRCCEAIE